MKNKLEMQLWKFSKRVAALAGLSSSGGTAGHECGAGKVWRRFHHE
jgi:hypothetical protein